MLTLLTAAKRNLTRSTAISPYISLTSAISLTKDDPYPRSTASFCNCSKLMLSTRTPDTTLKASTAFLKSSGPSILSRLISTSGGVPSAFAIGKAASNSSIVFCFGMPLALGITIGASGLTGVTGAGGATSSTASIPFVTLDFVSLVNISDTPFTNLVPKPAINTS